MQRADNDLTDAEWQALRAAWGRCAYCGCTDAALQRDCVQPIRLGGRYTVTNVVPACGSCNASKGHREVTTWLRRRRLDESAFLTSHREVLGQLGFSERPFDTSVRIEPATGPLRRGAP